MFSMFVAGVMSAEAAPLVEPDASEQGQEIIVTGERIERSLQETAASVAVTTADDIENQAAPDRIEQILQLVPNIQLGAGDQGPAIRGDDATGILQGADAFLGGSRPRATIQVDGRALGYNEFIYGLSSVWDVERVEVYRGPQTTAQGRNAIAGAIFIETNDPTYRFKGRARGIIGNYDTYQGSGVLSGPIVADQVAARVAVDVRQHRSYVDYGTVEVVGADPKEDDFALVRAKLRIEPRATPGLALGLTYVHLDSRGPQGEAIDAPFERRERGIGNGGYFTTNVDSLVGDVDYDLGGGAGLSFTAAYGDSTIERFAPPGGGQIVIETNDLSLEGVLRYQPEDGAISGLIGVYHLDFDQQDESDLSAFIGFGSFEDEQRSLGVFGEATVRPAPRLAVTAGLRYQRDNQDRFGFLGTPAFGFTVDYDRTFDALLPKAEIAYELSDRVTLGASARRGFNPGGTTISFETGLQDSFEDEKLWNYELFLRSTLAGGRLRLNANAFYSDFEDAQRPQTRVLTSPSGGVIFEIQVDNAPDAESYGIEVEAAYTLARRLSLKGAVGLLETKIKRTLDPLDPIRGRDFQRAPNFTAAVGASWRPIDALKLDATLRHNSDYFSDDRNDPLLAIEGATVLDAKASYDFGPFSAFAFARNAFDEFYMTQLYTPTFGTAGDPQEYGIGLEARF